MNNYCGFAVFMIQLMWGDTLTQKELYDCLEDNPIIAAVHENLFDDALACPCDVIFLLGGNLLTLEDKIKAAKSAGKIIFVHIDLADGIGKDKAGVGFIARLGADGIISTRANLIRFAKESGLLTVQRFFVYDTQGVESINSVLYNNLPDVVEIMPGVIGKIIEQFSRVGAPLIAGGLIETKGEVTDALNMGACAVSTGKKELWYM